MARARFTYREFYARARQLAHALTKAGIKRGDTVAILAANTPAMLEAHYAAPMIGAMLNPINIRLDAPLVAFCLEHGEAKLLLADREFHGYHRSGTGAARRQTPHRRRHRRCRDGRCAELRQHRVRGFHRLRRSGLRLSRSRGRVGQHLPALHLRHHRQSQGRRLQSPRRLPRCARQRAHLQARPREPLPVDPAHVPLLGLDLHLGGHGGRRHPRLPAQGRAQAHLRRHRRASRDAYVRRAHRAQHAGACAGRHAAAAARAHQGRDRRRGASGDRHRAHGGHGLRGAAPLRHDGELRSLDLLRADAGVAGPAGRRALPEDGAAGDPQSAHRAIDGRRREDAPSPCPGTGRRSASSCWPATR